MSHSRRRQRWRHFPMMSWWRWCWAQTSLCWSVPGGCWGCDGGRPCCCVHRGPVVTVDDNKCLNVVCKIGLQVFVIAATLFTTGGLHDTFLWKNQRLNSVIKQAKLTGKKILCGPFSLLDRFLKRPLDGFRNHMRWTPPFSSPSSSREGCSGLLEGKTHVD